MQTIGHSVPGAWRRRRRRSAMVLLAMAALPAAGRAAEMAARLDPEQIYLGTQAALTVTVVDAPGRDWPTVEPVAGLRITHLGSPSLVQDLFRGTVQQSFRFLVTPEKTGVFTIPSVSLQVGQQTLKRGPFTLRVIEAVLKSYTVQIDPEEAVVGETATLVVAWQGVRPGMTPVVPQIPGLTIRSGGIDRVDTTREGLPISIYTYEVTASRAGTYTIAGFTLDGVPADPIPFTVSAFVVVGTQVADGSLTVGQQTAVHVVVRGLPPDTAVRLVAPAGVQCSPSPQRYSRRPGESVFSFDVTPTEPGTITLREIQLPDGRKAAIPKPVVLNVRRGGAQGILSCRGIPRSEESVVGAPFVVDYEVFFRGDLQGILIDPTQAAFYGKEHIRVEPVDNPTYPDWQGAPYQARFGQAGRITILSGSGELNRQKEQLLRFSLKITPMATGELPMDGLRVILGLQVKEERRSMGFSMSSIRTEQFDKLAETPPHRVSDPPGMAAPPFYRGAVGTFTFATELDRTTAAAMSPLTLTMRITGEGVGPKFNPPPLTEVPDLTRDFDVSPTVGGGEVKDRTITFTQVIRPRSEAVKQLPALPLVFYDYQKKKYETVYSLPIPIQVLPGSLVGAGAMQVTTTAAAPATAQPVAASPDESQVLLGANYDSLGAVVTGEPLGVVPVAAILAVGPLCVAAVWVGRQVARRHRPRATLRHRRKALVASLDSLTAADNFFVRLADVLQAYLRLEFDLPPGELSADTLARTFDAARVDPALRRITEDLLAVCDAGRFATGSVATADRDRLIRQTRQLFERLARRPRR